jgi:hypothetical protein
VLRGWAVLKNYNTKCNFNLQLTLFGLNRLWKFWFKIRGFGFKFIKIKEGITIKANFTHRILLLSMKNCKMSYNSKSLFNIQSRNIHHLWDSLFYLLFYYRNIVYKKLGVYLKGTLFKLKLAKKKLKF